MYRRAVLHPRLSCCSTVITGRKYKLEQPSAQQGEYCSKRQQNFYQELFLCCIFFFLRKNKADHLSSSTKTVISDTVLKKENSDS